MEIKLSDELKDELIAALIDDKVQIFFDEKWAYPNDNDAGHAEFVKRVYNGSQKTVPILDFMFKTEYNGGYILKFKTEDVKNEKSKTRA